MNSIAAECCEDMLNQELDGIVGVLLSLAGEDITEETLTSVVFEEIIVVMKTNAPTLWHILQRLAYTPEQERKNKEKNPDKVSSMKGSIIAMI